MKDYNQIASELLEKRDAFVAGQKRKRRNALRAGTSVICVVAVAVGVGLWKKNDIKKPEVQGGAVTQIYSENFAVPSNKNEKKITGGTDTTEEFRHLVKTIITDYPTSGEACYATPRNGTQSSSIEVNRAIEDAEAKNQKAVLLVTVEIWKDLKMIENNEDEIKRLSEQGYHFYTIPVWEYQGENAEKVYRQETVALLTSDMIKNFSINPEYGYFIDFLHNGDGTSLNMEDAKPIAF